MKTHCEMFETSFGRPRNYFALDAETQWAIDKNLGILDMWYDPRPRDLERMKDHYEPWPEDILSNRD
jgi:hypothetical protein